MAKIIDASEVSKSRRGRTAQTDPALVELFGSLNMGRAVVLDEEFAPATDTTERAKVRGVIARNWSAARTDGAVLSVNFSGEGVAQVSIHKAKTEAALAEAAAEAEAAKPAAKGKAKR